VTDVAKQNHVTDIKLENEVVWAIQDFNPKAFLQMLKPYRVQAVEESTIRSIPEVSASPIVNEQPVPKAISFTPVVEKKSTESKELPNIQLSDEISINFPDTSKSPQEKKIKG